MGIRPPLAVLEGAAGVDVLALGADAAHSVHQAAIEDQSLVVDGVVLVGAFRAHPQRVRVVVARLLGQLVEAREAVPAVVLAGTHLVWWWWDAEKRW